MDCDNRWDEAIDGRLEVNPATGEIGHYTRVQDPILGEVVEIVYRGGILGNSGDSGSGSYNAGYQYAAGYYD